MTPGIPILFDRQVYLARQQKASLAQEPLLAHVAAELEDRLGVVNHSFARVLVIASHPEKLLPALQRSGKCGEIEMRLAKEDDDLALAPASYDLVLHLMDLHCVNDVPGTLAQCARALEPDGLFLACSFAAETLNEVRQSWLAGESASVGGASLRVAPMIGVREMGGLLQRAGLALPVADADHLTLRYADALALLREIKSFGFANPLHERRRAFTSRRMLELMLQDYQENFADADGRVRVTLDILWALAWKPHDSQPKPKKPGSANVRLADVLKSLDHES